jgi:hypothetical protein
LCFVLKKFYKTLSELKGQIEHVLKQGRTIVDKKQVDNGEELTRQLDLLKIKYNELGSRVTNSKNELEKAFRLAKRFRKEHNLIADFLGKIDGELRKIEQKPLSKNYNDELDWIRNTKNEINKVETINLETMHSLKRSLEEIVRSQPNSSGKQLSGAAAKISEIEQKVANIQQRVDERASFLHEQARRLDESYEAYFAKSREISIQIETFQNDLIEAERVGSRELIEVQYFIMICLRVVIFLVEIYFKTKKSLPLDHLNKQIKSSKHYYQNLKSASKKN